uniref:C-type lectin domain-containing protein n=1 Tax=Steinernema glaseri TaxID=37863 RepID=A0A1I7YNE0_9BILA
MVPIAFYFIVSCLQIGHSQLYVRPIPLGLTVVGQRAKRLSAKSLELCLEQMYDPAFKVYFFNETTKSCGGFAKLHEIINNAAMDLQYYLMDTSDKCSRNATNDLYESKDLYAAKCGKKCAYRIGLIWGETKKWADGTPYDYDAADLEKTKANCDMNGKGGSPPSGKLPCAYTGLQWDKEPGMSILYLSCELCLSVYWSGFVINTNPVLCKYTILRR